MSKLKTHYEQVPLASLKFFKSGVQQEEMPGDPRQDSGKRIVQEPLSRQKTRLKSMTPTFDIFQKESESSVRWCGTAATLEEAKVRVQN